MGDVIVAPDVPEEDARLLRERGPLLARIRRGWQPTAGTGEFAVRLAQFRVGLIMLVGFLALSVTFGRAGVLGLVFAAVVTFLAVKFFQRGRDDVPERKAEPDWMVYELAQRYDGRYILMSDLDQAAQALLARAQQAVGTVTESRVNKEGLLDDARNAVMLPAQEWQIAQLLAKLSALRTQHHETVADGVTPEVAAVAEPLARALDSSEAAVVARVEALERYAGNVADAERAYLAHHQIEELRGRLHQYEELVAESGADGFAVPELDRLAEDAGRLEQALRRSVRSAQEAFRYLEP